MRYFIKILIYFVESVMWAPIIFMVSMASGFKRTLYKGRVKKFALGSDPIINNVYYAQSLRLLGHQAHTIVSQPYSINKASDFDYIVKRVYWLEPPLSRRFAMFSMVLWRYDCVVISLNGFFIGGTPLEYLQSLLFKMSQVKVIVLPYGSDGYAYKNIRNTRMQHAMQVSYPDAARYQAKIERRVDYWSRNADAFVPGIMGADGMGRWDVLIPSTIFIDTDDWAPSSDIFRDRFHDGVSGTVVVAHTPNHRGVKGTEFLIAAIERMKSEGILVELRLFEGVNNEFIKQSLRCEVDILVEKLVTFGHGLSALEGMASGLPVLSSPQDNDIMEPFRIWSYYEECPIVGSSTSNIYHDLKYLIQNPGVRKHLGNCGREYVCKYQSLASGSYFFKHVIAFIFDGGPNILNIYHPLLGEYHKGQPKVKHGLIRNKIITQK